VKETPLKETPMNEHPNLGQDLEYVRDLVEQSHARRIPALIHYFWAVVVLIGFPLLDLQPNAAGLYWIIAGPLGLILTLLLGRRHSRATGQDSRTHWRQYGLHWLGVMAAVFLSLILVLNGTLEMMQGVPLILLILALGYFMAGLYQVRALLWIGLLLALCYLVVIFIHGWVWTVVGVAFSASLVATALIGVRRE
jgi:hypothetical protein